MLPKELGIKVVDSGTDTRHGIKRCDIGHPLFIKPTLIILISNTLSWPYTHPNTPLIFHWRKGCRMHLYYDYLTRFKYHLLHTHRGLWLYVAIGTYSRYILKQCIGNADGVYITIVFHPYEQIAWTIIARKVVSKSTDGLPKFIRILGTYRTLYTIALQISQEALDMLYVHRQSDLIYKNTCFVKDSKVGAKFCLTSSTLWPKSSVKYLRASAK